MKFTKTVRASRKAAPSAQRSIRANRRMIRSDEEIEEIDETPEEIEEIDEVKEIEEIPEAPEEDITEEILFEASDVAEVLAEVTGEPVDYTVDDETTEVTFTVGDDEITITPDGDEEVVEESTRLRGRKIDASRKVSASRRARK